MLSPLPLSLRGPLLRRLFSFGAVWLGCFLLLVACTTTRSEPLKAQEDPSASTTPSSTSTPSPQRVLFREEPIAIDQEGETVAASTNPTTRPIGLYPIKDFWTNPTVGNEPSSARSGEEAPAPVGSPAASAPVSTAGAALPRGALDKSVIRAGIKGINKRIKDCYEEALLRDPSLSGKVTIFFVIGVDGKVFSAVPKSPGLDPGVGACVAGVIATLTFPPPRGGGAVEVTYPFIFQTPR